jgi:hypothetical protein
MKTTNKPKVSPAGSTNKDASAIDGASSTEGASSGKETS